MPIKFTGKVGDFLKIGVAAAARGDLDAIREILKAKPKWIHRIGSHGRTMLWEACHKGRLEMAKYLVRRKADINACGSHYTPYFVEVSCYCIARYKRHDDVADFLLAKGADVDIHTAAFLGDTPLVKKFLRKKSRLNEGHPQYAMAEKGQPVDFVIEPAPWATPLCYALRGGNLETVQLLIDRGAKIKGNEEALFIAANDDYDMVRLLLENGAEVSQAPLIESDDEFAQLLEKHGARSATPKELSDELVYLCRGDRGGNPDEVRHLLKFGADVNHQDHKGKTALHRAAKAGFIKTMQILIDAGADLELADNDNETPLFEVARSTIRNGEARVAAAKLLLKHGAKFDLENRKGQSLGWILKKDSRSEAKKILRLVK